MVDVDWGHFYSVAVTAWGLAPSEFWNMSPAEWWLIYEAKRPRDKELDYAGNLNDADCEELSALLG